jgi:type IV secretion system protein VirB10
MSWLDLFKRRRVDPLSVTEAETASAELEDGNIPGERAEAVVQRAPALQSRVTNYLAFGLMSVISLGLLGWYFVHSVRSRASARVMVETQAQEKAKGEMPLRPLGRVDPPRNLAQSLLGEPPEEPPPEDIPEAWLQPAEEPMPVGPVAATPNAKSAEQLRLERQLAGPAFSAPTQVINPTSLPPAETGDASLGGLLKSTRTDAVRARMLATQRLLLPKGAFLDCTLETAIDSSLPGMTTCVLATDSFGADGSVVLLERGTKLVGETRGQVRAGAARLFVLWTEARTPSGVVVPLASPGTDELGRSGLPGHVQRHFFERFGAAILVSVIDGAVQGAANSQRGEGDTLNVNPSSSSQVMTEVLKSTIAIPPTVTKPQGDRIQVLVARDLDFRSVYELRPAAR